MTWMLSKFVVRDKTWETKNNDQYIVYFRYAGMGLYLIFCNKHNLNFPYQFYFQCNVALSEMANKT